MSFLEELEQITNAYQTEEPGALVQEETKSDTEIQNPETSETWFTTAAESQDYKALNQEIENDRTTSKIYIAVGSGISALGANACLGNAVLETTYNPVGYMTFSGVIAVAIISGGLSGSRINGKTFYSSPWLLSSVGAGLGVVGGAYAASRPYFQDKEFAYKAADSIREEIKQVEVKPQKKSEINLFDFAAVVVVFLVVMAALMNAAKK
ncbi:hypothetical protein CAL7716_107750 (plasmid) [Calothrix sp. PCC 7716]|nr:hypothetical protein CAL7716_107750 [Calothrix sp. PCC 7716]